MKDKNLFLSFIRAQIHQEILAVVSKILIGIMLTAIIIYSVIQVGGAYQVMASQWQNAYVFELVGFGVLLMAAIAGFYLLFKGSYQQGPRPGAGGILGIDYEMFVVKFAEGFLQGLETKKPNKDIPAPH